jgi:hypothetical protein
MTPEQQQIAVTLDAMFEAWNREDQAAYLTYYWDSEELRWSMKGIWHKGLASMRELYGDGYPRGAMGLISKSDLEITMLARDVGIALYRWEHDSPSERIAGCTSQVFRRFDEAWLVIHENSARVPKE